MIEACSQLGNFEKVPFEKVIRGLPKEGYDLLERMFELDHTKRITAAQALKHPYLADLHNPEDEPTRPPVSNSEFEFEKYELTNEQLKGIIH